ncbi:MAG: hypothetical protein AB9873_17775 [Syntrophobacteraceae bacterium]
MPDTTPQIRCKTWQMWNSFRRVLGDALLQKVYQRGTRQLQRWSADPDFTAEFERNPMDRYELVLSRLMEIGREDLARAAVSRQAHVVGCELRCIDELNPDRSSITEEILDDHPPLVAFHQAIRNGEDAVVVHQLYQDARREIEETYALYARSVAKVGS